jgi:hypothetical protein
VDADESDVAAVDLGCTRWTLHEFTSVGEVWTISTSPLLATLHPRNSRMRISVISDALGKSCSTWKQPCDESSVENFD